MDIQGRTLVITGAGAGIGAAIATRFASRGARVVVGDLSADRAAEVAERIGRAGGKAVALTADASDESGVAALVDAAKSAFGRVDIMCSNAGVNENGGPDAPDDVWERSWSVNVMAHVYAARAVLPEMRARGEGYILNNCSAAGLLTAPGAASYAATKHAAVAFAEWLAVTYGADGIRVSAICPQAVRTTMFEESVSAGNAATKEIARLGLILEPDEVAAVVEQGVRDERFLILPHPEVARLLQKKAADVDAWIGGMQRFLTRIPG